MPRNRMSIGLIVPAAMIALATSPAHAVTPEEAFAAACGGCHASDQKILRKIPEGSDTVRRAWISNFMAGHHNKKGAAKPEIIEYLLEKSAAPKT